MGSPDRDLIYEYCLYSILRNLISCFIALLQVLLLNIQFNLSTTVTLGTEESGHCREVAVVERLKQESMYGLSAKENGRCREVAVTGG